MSYGVNFKGKSSLDFGFIMKSSNRQLFPDVTRQTVQIPGVAGLVDFNNDTYGEKQIDVLLQNSFPDMSDLMNLMEQVGAWLYDDGEYHDLSFDDQPTRIYKAKMATKIDVSPDSAVIALQVSFVCNPPWPYVNGVLLTPEDISWNNQDQLSDTQWMKSFTTSGNLRITNTGTLPAKPKIKLLNNIPSGLLLAYSSAQWQYNASLYGDGIIIDCESETVTRMSDGVSLLGNVDGGKDAFFELHPGQIEIDVTAPGIGAWPSNLIVIVDFTPQGVS